MEHPRMPVEKMLGGSLSVQAVSDGPPHPNVSEEIGAGVASSRADAEVDVLPEGVGRKFGAEHAVRVESEQEFHLILQPHILGEDITLSREQL